MNLSDVFGGRAEGPRIERVRHDTRRRSLRVDGSRRITPGMLRVTLSGEDLDGFRSPGFDDHVKLFVPGGDERRDYTPRRFDPAARTLELDFALHDAGPATAWALAAKSGDRIDIGGPRGSALVSSDVRRWLLVGDETALPAIGRRIEEADAGTEIVAVVAVTGAEEQQTFETRAALTTCWVHRPIAAGADPAALLDALRAIDVRPETFVWIAAEAGVARAVRDHLVGERGQPRGWTKAGGYWIEGRAAGRERIG